MPLVLLRYSEYARESGALMKARQLLPDLVSRHLSVEGEGKLFLADIEIWAQPCSKEDCDPNDQDLQVVIFANHYPQRAMVLEEAEVGIRQGLIAKMPARLRGYVWILLCPAAFGEFNTGR
jgi:hypothetical protein